MSDVMEVITISKPTKEVKNLITWLKANMSDDKLQPHMQFIWHDEQRNWWAFNGYAIVRGTMWDDKGKFVSPGLYRIITNDKLLIELGVLTQKQCYSTKNLVELWSRAIDLQALAIATFDPKILLPIIKPFGQVTFHSHKSNDAAHLVLNDADDLPFGRYGAVLMPMNLNDAIHDRYKMAGFTVRYPMPTEFRYYHDAGHGWLEVEHEALLALGIPDKISEYSYMNGSKVYLEEDADMGMFLHALKDQYKIEPTFKDVVATGDRSFIREYADYRFKFDQVQSIEKKGE